MTTKIFTKYILVILILPALATPLYSQSPPTQPLLTLADYLHQVREGNGGFKGSTMAQEGASLRGDEWKLLTRPNLIASAQYINDRRETGDIIVGDVLISHAYSLGLQEQTPFGTSASLTYNLAKTSLPGADTMFAQNEFVVAGPVLQLTQPLWRNWFGHETQALQEFQSAQADSVKFNEEFNQISTLANAEGNYWQLSLAREAVAAAQDTFDRAQRLRGWSSNRQRLSLADRSDLLQADSALLARQLELQNAKDDERAAARAFNTMRGLDSDIVDNQLANFDAALISKLAVPDRTALRADVLASEQRKRLAEANAKLGAERNKPSVNLTGSFGLNGRDPAVDSAVSESFGSSHPNYAVGVALTVPLDIGTLDKDIQGYKKEAAAANVAYQNSVFQTERLWQDLSIRFKDSINRYMLATRMENAQKQKLDYERVRHQRGRTTTYQVIQFEQDFASAQLARIRAQADVLTSHAQLKTFGGAL